MLYVQHDQGQLSTSYIHDLLFINELTASQRGIIIL